MTVRRTPPNGNLPGHRKWETRQDLPVEHGPLLTLRAALILIAALVIGAAAGILAYLAGARPAEAVLTGGGAFGATVALLNTLIG
jgi:hypothetical protein